MSHLSAYYNTDRRHEEITAYVKSNVEIGYKPITLQAFTVDNYKQIKKAIWNA